MAARSILFRDADAMYEHSFMLAAMDPNHRLLHCDGRWIGAALAALFAVALGLTVLSVLWTILLSCL